MQLLKVLLTRAGFLLVLLGFYLLWFGLKQDSELVSSPTPTPLARLESAALGIEGEKALVSKVVDGDTIEILSGEIVRFVGIDTPETVDPNRPVGCFGRQASNETKTLLSGKKVILQKDISETDKYGRLLRLVFLPLTDGQTLFVNDYLLRAGFAKVSTYPPDVKYHEQFLQAETEARVAKRGLWDDCY